VGEFEWRQDQHASRNDHYFVAYHRHAVWTVSTAGGGGTAAEPPNAGSSFWLPLVGPTSLLTGILFYFGYVNERAFYSYFGVSLSALDFSNTTYLEHIADTFLRPVATLVILLVILFVLHYLLDQVLSVAGVRSVRAVVLSLSSVAAVLVAVGLYGLYGEPRGLVSPLSLAASGVLLEYSVWTASRYADPGSRIGALTPWTQRRRGLIAALVLIATFWAVTDVAVGGGFAGARRVENGLPWGSRAVVYSEKDLHLSGWGVEEKALGGKDTAYHFRYSGLAPLLYARGRWFLLPVGWSRNNDSDVIVLLDDASRVRVDLAPR
jgi:hypothetical protein